MMLKKLVTHRTARALLCGLGFLVLFLPLHEGSHVRADQTKPTDYDQLTKEATDLLSQYIQINTTNPPGNEVAAARFLKERFLADGIAAEVMESQPGRGIVAARLKGTGKRNKALLLLSHMDVVSADPQDWKVPPFSGQIKDGEIWGRGALDDKGPGVVELMAMLAIKRSGVLLDRDILFLATADEEEGGKLGAGWVVDNQPDLYGDAGFLLNEGGDIRVEKDKDKLYAVSVTEKSPLWLRLTATGPSGHSATPPEETSVTRLVKALHKIGEYRPPVKVVAPVEEYYRIRAELDHDSSHVRDLRKALKDPAFSKEFLSVPGQSALVHNTVTPTVLSASQNTNVIPSAAYAELDCRLLPGEDPKNFQKVLKEVIDDDKVRIDEILNFPSLSSPEKSELMSAIETLAKREDNGATVIPNMLSGFNDSHYFREKGIIAYGFIPIESSADQATMLHGVDERLSIANLHAGIERMVELLRVMGGR